MLVNADCNTEFKTTTPNVLIVRVRLTYYRISPDVLVPRFLHVAFVLGCLTTTPRAAVLPVSSLGFWPHLAVTQGHPRHSVCLLREASLSVKWEG